jgi:hypothetical protein
LNFRKLEKGKKIKYHKREDKKAMKLQREIPEKESTIKS